MWSSSRFAPVIAALLLAAALPVISACSFTPVYGNGAAQQTIDVRYGEPATRLDQIVYQDLALRLGTSVNPDAPLVTVSTTSTARKVGRSKDGTPSTANEAIVSGSAIMTASDGTKLISISRKASASYTSNGQVLADRQALVDAEERAAHALADQLRLVLVSEFINKYRAR